MNEGHELIIGRSGFGKSTFLENEILEFAKTDFGFFFFDPHGASAERIADTIPCIYFDAATTPFGYNPLKNIPPRQHPLIAAQVLYALKAIFGDDSWGPRLNNILYNAIRLALDNSLSLNDISGILTDKSYRARLLAKVSYRAFWERFERWDDRYRNEAIEPVLNKLSQLDANPTIRNILGRSTFRLLRILAKNQRVVVNLAKGKIGDEPAHLLGALLLSALYSNAQQRAAGSPPFRIFADEFQNFATQSFADILSEARKYGLFLTLCHQYLDQLPDGLAPAVFANVNRITAFNLGAEDATFVGKEMDLNPRTLQDLARYEAWQQTRLTRELIKTLPPAPTSGRLSANQRRTAHRYI